MRFLLYALVVLLPLASSAETIRVAVARGAALEFVGTDLVARTAPEAAPVSLGRTGRLEAVGPFVSNGEALAARYSIEDRSGGRIHIGGTGLLGTAEVIANDQGLLAIDHVDIETYVASVVGSEMAASWPAAALEAQAIAARTYVLKKKHATSKHATYDVEASVLHQAYKGAKAMDARTRAAAEKTRGMVVTYGGELADAFFFSTCRGKTESAEAAFGTKQPYLVPTSCKGGDAAPRATWTVTLQRDTVSALLRKQGVVGDELTELEVASRTGTGRMAALKLTTRGGSRTLPAGEFRRLVGYGELPSLDAEVSRKGDAFVFSGGGFGHGVGLCQWCARGQATSGDSADEILAHAYPGTTLMTVY